ncbi:hypothetical protein A2U01_0103614, partial [Trifolium medium]|nr:hypothetical protein [Trifolium medium]
ASLRSTWADFGKNSVLGRLAALWLQPCALPMLGGHVLVLPAAPSAGHAAPSAGHCSHG